MEINYPHLYPTDYFKMYSTKTSLKITIGKILVYKKQPEIKKSKIFTRLNLLQSHDHGLISFIFNNVETSKDFRFHYFWLYFVYQNFQNGFFPT